MSYQSWSYEGEDLILKSLLRNKIGLGHYLDIGSGHPLHFSNSFLFYSMGWSGLAIDGRDLEGLWRLHRPRDRYVQCLAGRKEGIDVTYWEFPEPEANTVDSETAVRYRERYVLEEIRSFTGQTRSAYQLWCEYKKISSSNDERHSEGNTVLPPDFVSIDVEGYEVEVLKGLLEPSSRWRPPILVVETKLFNFASPFDNEIVQYLCNRHGYRLISKTPLNAFFIDPKNNLFHWIPRQMLRFPECK